MKICPTCRRTYDDDALNFCLEDGSVLNVAFDDSSAPTIAMHAPRPTAGAPPPQSVQQTWTTTPATSYSAQPPKKKSRGWVWAILILVLGVLLCGGGIAGMFVYLASFADTNTNRVVTNSNWRSNTSTNANTNSSSIDPSRIQAIGLEGWAKQKSEWGTNEFRDGELYMASREKGNYFVIVGDDDHKTEKAVTRVTVRNIDNADSGLGYGLVVHSDSTPLQNDYAFLIDTKRKRFRVVKHDPENELSIVAWTTSKFINEGTGENILEVRDKPGKMEFYLNGELASTVTNKGGPSSGVPGLYAGDAAKVAFKKLEIIK